MSKCNLARPSQIRESETDAHALPAPLNRSHPIKANATSTALVQSQEGVQDQWLST